MFRLRTLRKERKISMRELGSIIGVHESTISLYETGKRQPDYDTLNRLADYFQVSVDYLLGRSDVPYPPEMPASSEKGPWIPVLGHVQAGLPIEAIEDIIDYEQISTDMAATGDHFALQVRGDSMEPRFADGDVVIVRKQEDVESGQVAVVIVNGDEATLKKIKKTPEGVMLLPSNPAYEPLFYSNEDILKKPVRILGKVVELRAKF